MAKEKQCAYRNKFDFLPPNQDLIDAGSLWTLVGNKLVLVDDDNFVETNLDLSLFEESKQ